MIYQNILLINETSVSDIVIEIGPEDVWVPIVYSLGFSFVHGSDRVYILVIKVSWNFKRRHYKSKSKLLILNIPS